jgi:transcriptional regulator with XRE-family HTH domain
VRDILRAERQRRRLSQAEAGELVGYSSSTLSRIEWGDRRLHLDELRRFADRYGIAPSRLGLATVRQQHDVDESGDHVQRRQFLVTAAGLTIPTVYRGASTTRWWPCPPRLPLSPPGPGTVDGGPQSSSRP